MTADEARDLLTHGADDEPVFLPPQVLPALTVKDLPVDVQLQVGVEKGQIREIEWDGYLFAEHGKLMAEGQYIWTRKHWDSPLGMPHYLDLVRRAIEVRSAARGDVKLQHYEDDGAFIQLSYIFEIPFENLGKGYDYAVDFAKHLEEVADKTAAEVGTLVAEVGQRISGWGALPLDKLVDAVETAKTNDEKGRALEELVSRLLSTIKGFTVTGRVRTETEEIDITVLNDSNDPRFRREEALILAECKNWSTKCGKDEFVLFKEKVENRSERCSLGILVSWNGFTTTVTKEMLRGTKEKTLIVPLDGAAIRAAVRSSNFADVLNEAWQASVNL